LLIYQNWPIKIGLSSLKCSVPWVSTDTKNDGKMKGNGQERRGKDDGTPSRFLADP
jgi:hypothetical protein